MTTIELRKDFEKKFEALAINGTVHICAFPYEKTKEDLESGVGKMSTKEDEEIEPATHYLFAWRPFIVDFRKLPETYCGFEVQYVISSETFPEEFRADWDDLVPYEVCWSEEHVLAYVREHALEICEKLNDFALTEKFMCDMITDGDFERHKKYVAEERAKRLSGAYDDMDDFDFDDFDDEGLEPPPR
ncbi:MAG TPA: hypothetical protein VI757_04980 [Bacteroidia bacterium]|nr:hypothetical protein [Bacteroidia bacterium]